ncbi:MAG: hypothetical protein M3P23_07405 [Actinomycetota bacterium]|nr:hypothetical protein [Actinomycetota bacterium]
MLDGHRIHLVWSPHTVRPLRIPGGTMAVSANLGSNKYFAVAGVLVALAGHEG